MGEKQKGLVILWGFYGLGEKAVLQLTAKPQKEELDLEDFL